MKKLFSVFVVLALVLGIAACNGSVEDNTLFWNIGADPLTIDPTLNGASDGGDVINQTFEGLVREIDSVVYPGIAESWVTSADGKTVTFTLRESNWSDGTPLTASDFVYSWKRGMDPRTASEYAWIWEYTNVVGSLETIYWTDVCDNATDDCNEYDDDGALVGTDYSDDKDDETGLTVDEQLALVGVKAIDDLTLEVKLVNPAAYFVSLMAFYHFLPVKQSAVEAVGGEDGLWAKNPDLVVSNGPFVLVDYTAGEGLRLEKNDEYWNKKEVYIEAIEGDFVDLETTAYAKYNAGEYDFIPAVPSMMIPDLMALSEEFYAFPLLGTYYYSFNLDRPEWQNAKLRRALALAINREDITEALSGGQIPAKGFVPVGFTDNEGKDFATESGDYGMSTGSGGEAEAVTLFAAAAAEMGKTVAELKTYLDGKVILYNTSEAHRMVAEMVQEDWKQVLGVELTLQNQEWAVFQDTRKAGNFDVARGGWLTDFMDPAGMLAIFTTGNAYNDPNYEKAAYDALLSESQSTTDMALHFQKLYAANDMLMADMPMIPIYYYSDVMMAKSYLKDWGRSVLGSVDFTHAKLER
ncbi:MAG: ABC transporter substrate-binding protein [Tenericutes bacterium HGW-Tenericutes-1]|jgi:oligopeptide transport system substrate-binding protein|nr:MAG: ABC transporter substrate-binding protein [Tenericutes bacterium HGW-Tenericutes-1]